MRTGHVYKEQELCSTASRTPGHGRQNYCCIYLTYSMPCKLYKTCGRSRMATTRDDDKQHVMTTRPGDNEGNNWAVPDVHLYIYTWLNKYIYGFVTARTKPMRASELFDYYLGHITYRHACHALQSHKGGARRYIVSSTKLRHQDHITQAGPTRSLHASFMELISTSCTFLGARCRWQNTA